MFPVIGTNMSYDIMKSNHIHELNMPVLNWVSSRFTVYYLQLHTDARVADIAFDMGKYSSITLSM